MFTLTGISKAVTEALNQAPDVDGLANRLGVPSVSPRIVAEYGGTHGATCLDYDPTQRLLVVGVDTGAKVLGANGLEALLATPHVEPARSVHFIPGTGRVLRLSQDGGLDVWCLRTQTLLASARWPEDVACVRGLRGSPFVLVGETGGCLRVAAVQAGADGGVLARRSYAVVPDVAMGRRADDRADRHRVDPESIVGRAALVAIAPRPRHEHARVLLAYADGGLSDFNLHRRRPASVARPNLERGELRDAAWIGGGGDVLATAHDAGAVILWRVPEGGRDAPSVIVPERRFHPAIFSRSLDAPTQKKNDAALAPTRSVRARGRGAPTAPFRVGESGGVLAMIGGEATGSPDPARLVPLAVNPRGELEPTGDVVEMPWMGPARDVALASPAGRPEKVIAAVVLSEGGQIHVHDARAVGAGNATEETDSPSRTLESPGEGVGELPPEGVGELPPEGADALHPSPFPTAPSPFPAAELLDPLPSLHPDCAPAAVASSARMRRVASSRVDDPREDDARLRRDAWGASWPVSGGAADDDDTSSGGDGGDDACGDDRDDDPSSRSAYHVVAAASGGNAGSVRVCREGGGRLTSIGVAAPGPNAGVSSRDRAVTRCHLACGGALLVVGRAGGAVELHWGGGFLSGDGSSSPSPATIRQLDSGLDLAAAAGNDDAGISSSSAFRLVGELGTHAAPIACVATDAECALLAVGDASGTVSLVDLRAGLLRFVTSAFREKSGESVAAAAFCPPVVGTEDEPAPDPNADADADPRSASNSRAMGSERGAATLVLAGTGSSVAFLDARTGAPVGRACQPKTPSAALAVAPLTAAGVPPPRSVENHESNAGFDAAARALWFNGGVAPAAASHPDDAVTALVGVASSEALRVYPANGAARGERHTVKKVSCPEPLTTAALVVPRGEDGVVANRPAAFAATSSRGRVLTWALPSLAPLAEVGPLPPLSAADGVGFSIDGFAFVAAGSGASFAKLALGSPDAGPKARPESGARLYDDELAAAEEAAEAAAAAMAAAAATTRAATSRGENSNAPSSPASRSSSDAGTIASNLGRVGKNAMRGDARSALASFGSVMRGARERAKEAAEKAKVRVKHAVERVAERAGEVDSSSRSRPNEHDDDEDDDPDRPRGAADLAVLFAEAEREVRKTTSFVPPPRAVSTETRGEVADDADRAELFRTSSGGVGGASGSREPRVHTAEEIRAKYGKAKSTDRAASGIGEVKGTMEETRNKLLERGEKLSSLQDKTARMQSDAEDFHAMAQKLAKQNQSWW